VFACFLRPPGPTSLDFFSFVWTFFVQVPQQQKFFAARADVPTHLKLASDTQVFYAVGGIMTVGSVLFVKGECFTTEVVLPALPFYSSRLAHRRLRPSYGHQQAAGVRAVKSCYFLALLE
jgi:hypothetical protein